MPFVQAYNGDEPYAFVSYAHKDGARIMEVLAALYALRVRTWYDEGIEVGANWPEKVATRLKNAGLVILFLSESFLLSQNCLRELNYAVSERKKLLCVRLDDAKLPNDVSMQLSTVPQIDARTLTPQAIAEACKKSGLIGQGFFGDGKTGYTRDASAGKRQKMPGWRRRSYSARCC